MSEELKPCPFCDGEADFVEGADDDGTWVAVACPECGAGSRQHYPVMDDARPHAQSAWNARAISPQQPDRTMIARAIAAGIWSESDAALYFEARYDTSPDVRRGQAYRAADRVLALLHPILDMGSGGAHWIDDGDAG